MESWRVENIATMACTVALVTGLYAMSGSFWSLAGMLLLLNMNYVKSEGRVMDKETTRRLAREAGIYGEAPDMVGATVSERMERFAALVAIRARSKP